MVVIICGKYRNNRSRTENVTEWTWLSKSRSNNLEDIGQGQRSSHETHLLVLVIICTKYGKNPSRTVDATERTRFSRSRPNDLENIGQGQRSLHATHPLMLMMICAKYGKNASRNHQKNHQKFKCQLSFCVYCFLRIHLIIIKWYQSTLGRVNGTLQGAYRPYRL